MKKITLFYLMAGLLALSAPALLADNTNTTNETPAAVHAPGGHRGDNRLFLKAIGLSPTDLKGLSREDRRAKIKDTAQSKLTDLQKKQADGSITDQEKTDMALIQKRLQHVPKS